MVPGRGRPAALLVVGLVLAGACGSRGGDEAVDTSSTSTPAPVVVTEPQGTPVPQAVEPPSAETPFDAPVAAGPQQTDPAPSAPGVLDGVPGPTPQVVPVGAVGSMGARYLRPSESERVLVQVLVQDGAAPQPAVPERIGQVLASLSGKPVSVTTAAVPGGPRSWSSDDLRALADSSAPAQTTQQAVLTLLFLRGGFAQNESAVGVAVRGDVAAVFAERVTEAAGVFGRRSAVEDAVALHEVGHLLGLVGLVVDTGRADPDHPGHSPNQGSVMYYAVESTLLGSVLAGGPPRDFDQDDLDELARIRNG